MPSSSRPSPLCPLLLVVALAPSLGAALAPTAEAQPVPRRVADLVTTESRGNSMPWQLFPMDDALFFSADDGESGTEPWWSDGTAEGTRRILDLEPGREGADSRPVGRLGERLIFEALGSFWSTDGTAEGTRFVADPCPGPCSSFYGSGLEAGQEVGGRLVFVGTGPEGVEPWVTDGTAEGTHVLADLWPGESGSLPDELRVVGDRLLFRARTEGSGFELWSTDGTAEGTRQVIEICPGACSGFSGPTALLGDRLLFTGYDETHGAEPWITDGTAAGTRRLADLVPGENGSLPGTWQTFGDLAYASLDACVESCVLRTDGTPQGTFETTELLPADRRSESFTATADRVFSAARESGRQELWTWDGNETKRILDSEELSSLFLVGTVGDRALGLGADGTGSDNLLIASDGTEEGTVTLAELGVYWLAPFGDRMLFAALDDGVGFELFTTDGTVEGTGLVKDIGPDRSDAQLSHLVDWNGRLAFLSEGQKKVRATDGQTVELLSEGVLVTQLVPFGELLAANAAGRSELWFFEPDGSLRALELPAQPLEMAAPPEMAAAGDRFYFTLAANGQQLWTSDGTAEGTRQVVDIHPDWGTPGGPPPLRPFPTNLLTVGEGVVFAAFEDEARAQLWYSGGSAESTRLLRTFEGSNGALRDGPRRLGGTSKHAFFTAFEDATGRELWTTDGTVEGTRLLADLVPGSESMPLPTATTPFLDGLALAVPTAQGSRIYRARAEGLEQLADFDHPGARIHQLAASGDQLYARVGLGTESHLFLVQSSGLGQGAIRRLDLPGPVASVHALPPRGALVSLDDGASGMEPWVTNGTEHRRLADIHPGTGSSSPGPVAVAGDRLDGGRLYFEADDGSSGRELWTVGLDGLVDPCPTEACLVGDRFLVRAEWNTVDGESGLARPAVEAEDSALLFFFEPDNWEMLIKVLDGCALNGHYWVYAALPTDVGLDIEVVDLETLESWTWKKPAGTTTPAVTATDAFATCP